MKKLTSLVVCLLLIVSNISSVFAGAVTLTVAVDSSTYHAGGTINITGTLLDDGRAGKGYNPTLVVEGPSGNGLYFSQWNDQEILENGQFSTFYTLNSDAPTGIYKVKVTAGKGDATYAAETNFEVVPVNTENPVQVTVATDRANAKYYTNESVTINGTVSENGSAVTGANVTVLFSKDGNQLKVDQKVTNGEGKYTSFINLTSNDSVGTYEVKVKAEGKEAVTTFTVETEPVTPPPVTPPPVTPPPVTPPPVTPPPVTPPPVTPPPVTPPPVDPPPVTPPVNPPGQDNGDLPGDVNVDPGSGSAKLVVDEKKLEEELNDPAKADVTLDWSNFSDDKINKLSVELNTGALQQIGDAKKNLVFKTETESLLLPSGTLTGVSAPVGSKLIFSMEKKAGQDVPATQGNNVLSSVYDFNILLEKDGTTTKVTNFKDAVTVSISLKGKTLKDKRKVAAYYYNEGTGVWEYVGGKLSGDNLEFTTNHFSQYAVFENVKTFADVANHWAKDEIEVLASREIIKGKTLDVFAPSGELTRAQFAILVARALNLPKASYEGKFKDLAATDTWAVYEVEAAFRAGIITGRPDGTFGPNDKITREQMAAMIVRAIEYKDKSVLTNVKPTEAFKDDAKIASYAKEYVQIAAGLGVIQGKADQSFGPKENTSRAQAAVVLYRLLGVLKVLE